METRGKAKMFQNLDDKLVRLSESIKSDNKIKSPASECSEHNSDEEVRVDDFKSSTSSNRGEEAREPSFTEALDKMTKALIQVCSGRSEALEPRQNRYVELPFYNGNTSDWLYFKTALLQTQSHYSEYDNISRLRRSLKGPALEAVKGLLITCNVNSTEILERLERQLSDSAKDICIFASQVTNIISTIQALNKIEYLHNPETASVIVDKFTNILRNKWFEFDYQDDSDRPILLKLVNFLDREADLNAKYAKPEYIKPDSTKSQVFNTKQDPCQMCHKLGHNIVQCHKFINMSISDRWKLARESKLCFRCLRKRTWKHRCKSQKCEAPSCQYYHHRLLHSDDDRDVVNSETQQHPSRQPETVGSTFAPQSSSTYLKVLPVVISGPKGDDKSKDKKKGDIGDDKCMDKKKGDIGDDKSKDKKKGDIGDDKCKDKKKGDIEFVTPDDRYYFKYFPFSKEYLRFEVKACNDAHIVFTTERNLRQPYHRVVIGGWNNTKSAIRMNENPQDSEKTTEILNGGEFRGFWIRWDSGNISVGHKGEAKPLLSWQDPKPFQVKYVGFGTGWGAHGFWKIIKGVD